MARISARRPAETIAVIDRSLCRWRSCVFCCCFGGASSDFVYSYYCHLELVGSSTNNNCCANLTTSVVVLAASAIWACFDCAMSAPAEASAHRASSARCSRNPILLH